MKKIKNLIIIFSSFLCFALILGVCQTIKVKAEYSSSTEATVTAIYRYKVSWSASWSDSTVTDDVDDYVTLTSSTSTLVCTVDINEFFENQITVTATSQEDSTTATCTLDTAGRLSGNGTIDTLGDASTGWYYELSDTSLDYDNDDYSTDYTLYTNSDDSGTSSNYIIYFSSFDFGFSNTDYFTSDLTITGNTLNFGGHDLNQTNLGDNYLVAIYQTGLENELKNELWSLIGSLSDDTTISINSINIVWSDEVTPFCDTTSSSINGTCLNCFTNLFGFDDYDDFVANSDVISWFSTYDSTSGANDNNLFNLEVSVSVIYDSNTVQTLTIDYPIEGLYFHS